MSLEKETALSRLKEIEDNLVTCISYWDLELIITATREFCTIVYEYNLDTNLIDSHVKRINQLLIKDNNSEFALTYIKIDFSREEIAPYNNPKEKINSKNEEEKEVANGLAISIYLFASAVAGIILFQIFQVKNDIGFFLTIYILIIVLISPLIGVGVLKLYKSLYKTILPFDDNNTATAVLIWPLTLLFLLIRIPFEIIKKII